MVNCASERKQMKYNLLFRYLDNFSSFKRILTLQLETFHKGFGEWFGGIWNVKGLLQQKQQTKNKNSFQSLPQMNLNLNFELKRPLSLPNLKIITIENYNILIKNINVWFHEFTGAICKISPFCNSYHSIKSLRYYVNLFIRVDSLYIASTRFYKIQINRISCLTSWRGQCIGIFPM